MSATPCPRRTVALTPRRRPDLAAPPRSRLRRGSVSADSTVSDGIWAIFIRNRTVAIRVAVTAAALAAGALAAGTAWPAPVAAAVGAPDTAGSGVPGRPLLPGPADGTGRPPVRRHAHRPGVPGRPLCRPDTSSAACRAPGYAATGRCPARDATGCAPARDTTRHAATGLASAGDRTAARGTSGDRTTAGHAVHRWHLRHARRDLRTSTEDASALRGSRPYGGVTCGPGLHRVLVDGC